MAEGAKAPPRATRIPVRTWMAIVMLGFVGQLAWNVENSWFNTFVFDEVTPDPAPIAWMVAVSAVVATLTTFVMGTWSDRLGKRKPFLLWGYILWGISTALFPTAVLFKVTGLIIFMVIVLDAVMGFFGSSANDAAYNAWLTDSTDETNRGKVLGVIAVMPILVAALTAAIGGTVIDSFGYFVFFYGVGGIVLFAGLMAKPLVQDADDLVPLTEQSYWRQLVSIFEWKTVTNNRVLFLVLLSTMFAGIASQISTPYLFIYLENYIGISKTQIGVITLVLTLISGLIAIVVGQFVDRWDRRRTAILFGILASIGIAVFGLLRTVPHFYLLGTLYVAPGLLLGIVTGAWLMDLYPKDERGRFQGVRMIFQVMLPMVVGPAIGSMIISRLGIPTILNGQEGFVPTSHIFFATAVAFLLALIPIMLTSRIGQTEMGNG